MSSTKSSWKIRLLYKVAPFLFKQCPDGNYHWWWHQICFCRMGEHTNDWNGGVYSFIGDEEMLRRMQIDSEVESAYEEGMSEARSLMNRVVVYVGDRRTGKTFNAAGWTKQDANRLIMVMHHRELRRLRDEYSIPHNQIEQWHEKEHRPSMERNIVFWDNVDLYLSQICHERGYILGGWSATVPENTEILKYSE